MDTKEPRSVTLPPIEMRDRAREVVGKWKEGLSRRVASRLSDHDCRALAEQIMYELWRASGG